MSSLHRATQIFSQDVKNNFSKGKFFYLCAPIDARSSNGRTADFGSVSLGSSPSRATQRKTPRNSHVAGGFAFWDFKFERMGQILKEELSDLLFSPDFCRKINRKL
jgi:hypothetical protein